MGNPKTRIAANNNLNLTADTPLFAESLSTILRVDRQGPCNSPASAGLLSAWMAGAYSVNLLKTFADKVAWIASNAYAFRRMDVVERASSVLLSMPSFGQYDIIGQYYRALCIKRSGNPEQAQIIFEGLFDQAPARLRLPLLLSIAGGYYDRGDFQSAGSIYREIVNLSAGSDPESLLLACRMIAQMRAIGGDAHGAAEDLEKMAGPLRIVGATQPFSYIDYLNSMAYTLVNVGRAPEAKRLCNIVLASPFAAAYPEWRETGEMADARLRNGDRVYVVIRVAVEDGVPPQDGAVKIEKVSSLASRKESVRSREAYQVAGPGEGSGKADVLNYSKWMKRKARSRKHAAHLEPYPSRTLDDLTMAELKVRIGRAVFKPGLHKTRLVRMIQAVEAIDRESSTACATTQPVDD